MWEYEISRASSFGTAQKDRGSFQGVFKALNRCSIIVSTTFILQEPLVAYRFPFHFCKHHCTLSGFNIEQKEPPVVRYTPTTGGFVMFLPKEVCARQWIQGEVLNLRMVADARQESTDNFGAEKHPRKNRCTRNERKGPAGPLSFASRRKDVSCSTGSVCISLRSAFGNAQPSAGLRAISRCSTASFRAEEMI